MRKKIRTGNNILEVLLPQLDRVKKLTLWTKNKTDINNEKK